MIVSERHITLTALTWIALAAMMMIVAVGTWGVVVWYGLFASLLPGLDFADVQTPLTACTIAFGFCIEVILVVTGILIGYILTNRIFHPAALRLVNALGVTIGVASLLIVAVFFQIPGPPPLLGLLFGSAALGGTILLVLLVLRSLLVRAGSLHDELEEVV